MTGGDWKEMFHACETGDIALVQYHVDNGIDINYQHPEILTSPLIESIRCGHNDIAKYLLENGADPHTKEIWGKHTPLSMAKLTKNKEMIHILNKL